MRDNIVDRVIDTVATAGPKIADGLLTHRGGAIDEENPTGDTAIEADVWANQLLIEALSDIGGVGSIASEEREEPIAVGDGLSVTIDPLDGSSNVPTNNLCGTIVGIFDGALPAGGSDIVAAAYLLYGPITTMVVAVDETVTELALQEGAPVTLRRDITLPEEPVVYGFGGKDPDWIPAFAGFAEEIRDELKLRYGGAMVGDVNQVLHHGGMFAYPALVDRPEGKLRAQFEGIPMGYIIEAAGGRASTGTTSMLEVEPEGLHDRTPVYLGNGSLIERLESALGDE